MNVPVFKSEAQRQAYWKKQRMLELQLDEANDSKISKAYHDVDFGTVPAIRDTRSIKEIEQDTNLQRTLAKKNALTLMNNDGYEADKLLDLIGKPDYATFNRFAPDIIEKLRNQIGRMNAIEAMKEIGLHFAMQLDPYRRVPPSADQIDNLIMAIDSRFTRSNKLVNDILQRLEAYGFVVGSGPIPPDANIPMSAADVADAISMLEDNYDDEEALDTLEEKSVGITLESNASLLEEISTAAESKGAPDGEEIKRVLMGEPTDQPTGDEPDGGDGGPIGDPKDDEGDGNGDDDDEETIITRPSKQSLERLTNLQRQWRDVGSKITEISMANEADMSSYNDEKRSVILSVAALAEVIGKDPDPNFEGVGSRDAKYNIIVKFWNANSKKIGAKLEKDINTINKMGDRESTNQALLSGLEYRLNIFQHVEFDPFRQEPGKIKSYTAADYNPADLVENAKLYLTLFKKVTDEVGSPNVVITRGGRDSTELVPSASYLYFDFIALKSIAKDDNRRTAKNITLGGLKKQLSDPIYQQTADYIKNNILSEDGGEGKSGSGFRRKGRRGRRR
jgi:hypothetical protein